VTSKEWVVMVMKKAKELPDVWMKKERTNLATKSKTIRSGKIYLCSFKLTHASSAKQMRGEGSEKSPTYYSLPNAETYNM